MVVSFAITDSFAMAYWSRDNSLEMSLFVWWISHYAGQGQNSLYEDFETVEGGAIIGGE